MYDMVRILKMVAMTGVAPAVVYSPLKRTWNIHSWIFVHRLSLFDYIAIKLVGNVGIAPLLKLPRPVCCCYNTLPILLKIGQE